MSTGKGNGVYRQKREKIDKPASSNGMPDAQNEERMFVPSLQNLLLQVWLLSDLAISLET